jgi:biotin-dependent enzyme
LRDADKLDEHDFDGLLGITECQIIQWFVQPGARVAQFDKICEVQSDKAAVEVWTQLYNSGRCEH